ncbi:transcription termination/antitermination protein NusA [Lachnospiraceae bacterium oral taxon 500]|nr:transcription termination/antitermination protein NusA [Lachnospiraceae bacterium oral taxon 500]
MNAEFIDALNQIEREKNIKKDVIIEALENSLLTACKKNFGSAQNITVNFDREKGDLKVLAEKEVVDKVEDPELQISLADAMKYNVNVNPGDKVQIEVTPKDFGRIAAQKAKQLVIQKIREAEKNILYNDYQEKQNELVTGTVQRVVKGMVIVEYDKVEAILAENEQVPGEVYTPNQSIKVYVLEVKQGTKSPRVMVSRSHPELVKRLFEREVPEIYNGQVEIKSISREAGSRTKIAVYAKSPEIDPIGACVGHNGIRVNGIVEELNGEKIDIIPWSEDPVEFIAASLSPSKVVKVAVSKEEKSAKVVVPDYQLSLAIGKVGQNVRLAAKLTGYRIDIKSESQDKELNFITAEEEPTIYEENRTLKD